MVNSHNKAFKWDSCRVAFWVCGDFCGENGLQKLGLGGIHPLTRRYMHGRVQWKKESEKGKSKSAL
ncbi:DUF3265 domain-containing protein [Vibrio vulnificus]|nr:DUF3265 domain-containing protein [Vibrio vulnificus]MCG8706728.1 DUF3265 domain-containing protein [Vibrio vulnificus]HAS8156397.1 DUF3265 domain-containing protein [Vibrio vulnificus]HDY7869328.1 DUF3265 domain-containing protein [Vibrio vulnificus]HDZ3276696.1 DUF3265 domain-containing protein [Vibrio vulnificus]